MILDLIGILCSIMVLNPSVREGSAFLFARTKHILPSQATPNTAPTADLLLPLCEHWETDNLGAVQVPLLREGNMEKAKRDAWNLKKNNPGSKRSDEEYTQQRVITNTPGLSSSRTGGTNLQQPWTEIMDMAPLSRQLSWPCACPHTPPSASALKPKWKMRFYLKAIALGIITDTIRSARKRGKAI